LAKTTSISPQNRVRKPQITAKALIDTIQITSEASITKIKPNEQFRVSDQETTLRVQRERRKHKNDTGNPPARALNKNNQTHNLTYDTSEHRPSRTHALDTVKKRESQAQPKLWHEQKSMSETQRLVLATDELEPGGRKTEARLGSRYQDKNSGGDGKSAMETPIDRKPSGKRKRPCDKSAVEDEVTSRRTKIKMRNPLAHGCGNSESFTLDLLRG
jgi:hypothetical protein